MKEINQNTYHENESLFYHTLSGYSLCYCRNHTAEALVYPLNKNHFRWSVLYDHDSASNDTMIITIKK